MLDDWLNVSGCEDAFDAERAAPPISRKNIESGAVCSASTKAVSGAAKPSRSVRCFNLFGASHQNTDGPLNLLRCREADDPDTQPQKHWRFHFGMKASCCDWPSLNQATSSTFPEWFSKCLNSSRVPNRGQN
jgi:hypothetical protein